jgi:hypothetical protein
MSHPDYPRMPRTRANGHFYDRAEEAAKNDKYWQDRHKQKKKKAKAKKK